MMWGDPSPNSTYRPGKAPCGPLSLPHTSLIPRKAPPFPVDTFQPHQIS